MTQQEIYDTLVRVFNDSLDSCGNEALALSCLQSEMRQLMENMRNESGDLI